MTVFLVRHAKAGVREEWTKSDHLRPLTKKGWAQAEGLVPLLGDRGITRLLSSHYDRCVQTLEPLGKALGLAVEPSDPLVEGATTKKTLALINDLHDVGAALSTHGDVMQNVIYALEDRGVPGADGTLCRKGSTWELHFEHGRVAKAVYLSPKAAPRTIRRRRPLERIRPARGLFHVRSSLSYTLVRCAGHRGTDAHRGLRPRQYLVPPPRRRCRRQGPGGARSAAP